MNKDEIMRQVIRAASRVQEDSGRPAGQISATTRPIGELAGFDSLSGLEAMIYLAELVGYAFPGDYNPFVSKDGRRALTIGEITQEISSILEAGKKS